MNTAITIKINLRLLSYLYLLPVGIAK